MNRALTLAASLLVVAGCSKQQPAAEAPAAATAAQTPMDAPVPRTEIDMVYSLVQPPTYERKGDRINLTVRVTNRGKATLSSAGRYPVHLGLVVLAPEEQKDAQPLRQDFVRVPLPRALASGESADVTLRFPVAPTIGGRVVLDAVQERVGWFRRYGQPVLTIGRFERCGNAAATACATDGTPLPVAH